MNCGLLIIGHGSRLVEAQAAFEGIVAKLRRGFPGTVQGAYLGLGQPDIPTAISQLIQSGVKYIHVVPLFLFPGKHVMEDIPAIVAQEATKYGHVQFSLGEFVGNAPRLTDVIVDQVLKEIGEGDAE